MNDYEIEEAAERFADHPLLGPATQTLDNLRRAVNRNSDGWPYWRKPSAAATKLMALIEGDRTRYRFDDERTDVTEKALKAAYVPIKAFRTRQPSVHFEIVEPWVKKTVPAEPAFPEARAIEMLAAANCGSPVGYRVIRETNAPRCYQPCLAPGSSPHSHPKIIGYLLVGTTGTVTTDANLVPQTVNTLHPFGTAA